MCIHINPLSDINSYLAFGLRNFVARIAVPFFFVSAGFFCFKKMEEDAFDIRITNKYATRMFLMYLAWFVIYNIPSLVLGNIEIVSKIKAFTLGYSHLWYLNASAFVFLMFGVLFYKKVNIKTVLVVCTLLYIIGLFGETYYGLLFDDTVSFYAYSSRNGLFFAPIYVAIGILFSYNKIKIKLKPSFIATMIFAVMWAFEVTACKHFGLARDFNMSLFMLPTVFFLFNVLLKVRLKEPVNTKILRNLSTYIYLLHFIVLSYCIPILTKIINLLFNNGFKFNSLEKYIITVFGSIIAAVIIIKLQQVKGFKWLKILS